MRAIVLGAAGGAADPVRVAGGRGARAAAEFAVRPGTLLVIVVGGRGYDGVADAGAARGGYGGGGAGAAGRAAGGGGGGASSLAGGLARSTLLLIAGGGGGAGFLASGGEGGTLAAEPVDVAGPLTDAGVPLVAVATGGPNTPGEPGRGASAGYGPELRTRGGGGGGGGYRGGDLSGGRYAELPSVWPVLPAAGLIVPGGAGGGGSSWAHPAGAAVELAPGVNDGDGSVVLEWGAS
ncbi:MAG: glycine-rich protein [Sporichthyaceae bacterium]